MRDEGDDEGVLSLGMAWAGKSRDDERGKHGGHQGPSLHDESSSVERVMTNENRGQRWPRSFGSVYHRARAEYNAGRQRAARTPEARSVGDGEAARGHGAHGAGPGAAAARG